MPVFKPKTRMISFRLSEDEYEWLRQTSFAQGARSVSDYARVIVSRAIAGEIELKADPATARIEQINSRMDELNRELRRLACIVEQQGLASTT